MYNAYFDFTERPFRCVARAEQYFPGSAIETARQTLARCIERGEGAGMVVGPSGTGKTLLCRVLAEQFRDSFLVALLSSGRLSTRRNLFQAILYELDRPYRNMDEGELRLALADYLITEPSASQGMLLLVDEAHTLPLRLLDEIRMLTNLVREGRPQVRLVLAGGSVLEERFASPKLDSFSQRLGARCYLESLNQTETQTYIYAQIDSAGGVGEVIFPEDTCRSVFQATDGVPRLINQLCDHGLLLAYVGGQRQVEPARVEEAWADLQQLPTPYHGESVESGQGDAGGGNVIEFGGLEDAADEPEDALMPSLRISPETEHTEGRTGEPAEQLERIEQMLADAGEDFQPAGSIGPEVELLFDEPEQLLHEEFAEEEMVTDRYAAAVEPAEAAACPSEPPKVDLTSGGVDAPRQQTIDLAEGFPEEVATAADPLQPAAESPAKRQTVPLMPHQPPAEAAEPDDLGIIVVEDDYDEAGPVTCPIVPVRRQEYGRLFAKLRRG